MHIRHRLKRTHGPRRGSIHASLYLACAMTLFWTLSEGVVSFIVPLKIGETGVSDTMLGIILGSSSIAGALFDLFAARAFKDTYYKRIFGAMFALCFLFSFIMLGAHEWVMFMIAMILWGVYYDLRNMGNFDYVARTAHKDDQSHSFGMLQTCQSIGWIAGPLIVGFLVDETVGWKPFAAIWIFLSLALFFFVLLVLATRKRTEHPHNAQIKVCQRGTWSTVRMLHKVRSVIYPSLTLIFMLNFMDAFFWSIGPLFAEHLGLDGLAGLFMTAWSLPALLLGWTAGYICRRFDKERIARYALLFASLSLTLLHVATSPTAILSIVFAAGVFSAIAWPAIQSSFSGFISDREDLEKEIESLEDLYTNLGYVVGPISAGIIADAFGYGNAFGALGVIGAIVATMLILLVRKPIDLVKHGPAFVCD